MEEIITLDYGSGGKKTARLIDEVFLPAFGSPALAQLGDGAVLGTLCFSTDSFVVSPCFFPGGDIGKLSVCGTVNDLCMCGGEPQYLSFSLIIEEGFPMESLKRLVRSAADTARACGVEVVTGDTKVVERGKGDGVYVNTAGIGRLQRTDLSRDRIREGDKILLSGTMGDHGAAVMLARNDLGLGGKLRSDCAPLIEESRALWAFGAGLRMLRDPTRGGVATTLNELVEGTPLCGELTEGVPIRPEVEAACAILGLDPFYCANEGKLLAIVAPEAAEAMLCALRKTPHGQDAAVIGEITKTAPGMAALRTALGGVRLMSKLTGAQLPRIC